MLFRYRCSYFSKSTCFTARIRVYCLLAFAMLVPLTGAYANPQNTDWQQWQAQQQQAFQAFKDARDQAFMGYLEQQWKEFELFKANVRDTTPKVATPPVAKHSISTRDTSSERRTDRSIATPASASTATATAPRLSNQSTEDGLLFFGHRIKRFWSTPPALPALSAPDQKKLAEFWRILSQSRYEPLVAGFKQQQKALGLGDWGSLQLAQEIARIQLAHPNEQAAYAWFLLTKAGLDVRIAFDTQQTHLLFGTRQTVYGRPFLTLNGKTYYADTPQNLGRLYSYPENTAYRNAPLNLELKNVIKSTGTLHTRAFAAGDQALTNGFSVNLDAGLISALASYPQLDLAAYFDAPPASVTRESLRAGLAPQIRDLPKRDAVNFLLHFVQHSFPYARDEEQFGEENYLTVEENLHYPYSDCEDRSVLLAWLIRDLLRLPVVALDFPGHVAIAVRLDPLPGDWAATLKGHTYVIADPTYIGADVGMAMPSVQQQRPKVIYL